MPRKVKVLSVQFDDSDEDDEEVASDIWTEYGNEVTVGLGSVWLKIRSIRTFKMFATFSEF